MEPRRLKQLGNQDSLDPNLLTIYRDGNGQLPDISRLKVHRSSLTRRLFLWLAILVGVASGGWWLVSAVRGFARPASGGHSLQVLVRAPTQTASGEEIIYEIAYRNEEKVALRGAELILRYPEGFTFLRAEPAPVNQYRNTWSLGRVEAGSGGTVRVTGSVVGAVGAIVTLSGTAAFQPENFSSPFRENFSHSLQVTTSIVALTFSGTERTIIGATATYTVAFANTSDRDLDGVLVELEYPPTFTFEKADPKPTLPPAQPGGDATLRRPNTTWYFPKLKQLARGEISISGRFGKPDVGGNGKQQVAVARIGFLDELGSLSVQQEERFTSQLVQPNLHLSLIVNGQPTDQPVNFGDTLNYRIVYKNLGEDPLEDVAIAIAITSELADWDTLQDVHVGRRDGSRLSWGKDEIAELARLESLDEGTIDFSLRLKPVDAVGEETVNFATVSTVSATVGNVAGMSSDLTVTTPPLSHTVNTSLELKAEGRYFDDDNLAVGSGPLPPVVDQKTSFRVYWSLSNNLHAVEKVTVTTKLSTGVRWEEKFLASTGQLAYDPEEQTVSWTMVKIAPKLTHEDVNAWFDISVLPKSDQVGKLLLLTGETNLTATDTETKSTIVDLKRSITSNLEDDPFGGGRGLVVELGG